MTRPKNQRRRSVMDRVWEAQGKCCSLCGDKMVPAHRYDINRGWSLDHVRPRSHGYTREGNVLLAHKSCNNRKGDRAPTGCEIVLLEAANARFGWDEPIRHGSYSDGVIGPTALAVALERVFA